jgi:hypothetical protein
MPNRRLVAVAGLAALILVGCSSPKVTIRPPASDTKTSTAAAQSTEAQSTEASPAPPADDAGGTTRLDGEGCLAVTQANLDLSAASNTQDARTAADILEKYEPSESAKDAIEHFVKTGGAQFDDPDYKKSNDALDKWVHQVCPR